MEGQSGRFQETPVYTTGQTMIDGHRGIKAEENSDSILVASQLGNLDQGSLLGLGLLISVKEGMMPALQGVG